jgi:glycosyltransferase involved in cell wall biosynthesis
VRRLRLLFVLGSLSFGGTERQVIEILRHLNRQRFAPLLYLIYRRGELLDQVPDDVPVFSYWERHHPLRLRFPGRILFSQIRDLSQIIAEQQVDLVYDRASHMAITAGFATPASVGRVSVVVADPKLDFANSHRQFRFVKRALLRRAYLRADRVLAVSDGVRQGLMQFHRLPPEQITTCPNVFDFARMTELAGAVCPDFAKDRFHIVCVGRLQREKGQQILLQAVDDLVHRRNQHGVLLWLVGDGPDEPALRRYAGTRGLEQYVRFEGYQSNPLPYMRRASVFCLPSLFEGMPNALVEAMGCGIPVIASDCPSGPREILADGQYGQLISPGNAVVLADALENSIRNKADSSWQAKAEAGRRHVEKNYSVTTGLERLESILLEIAAAKHRQTTTKDTKRTKKE